MIPSTPVVHHQIANVDQSFDLYAKFEYLIPTRSINAYQEPRWLVEAILVSREWWKWGDQITLPAQFQQVDKAG